MGGTTNGNADTIHLNSGALALDLALVGGSALRMVAEATEYIVHALCAHSHRRKIQSSLQFQQKRRRAFHHSVFLHSSISSLQHFIAQQEYKNTNNLNSSSTIQVDRVLCTKKMEKAKQRANGTHILVVPLPAPGHINPMLQFSKRLASQGLRVTLVTISSKTHEPIETRLSMQERNGYPICCLVYEATLTWALDIAKGLGIAGASFFTQACAVGTVYYNVQQKLLRVPLEEDRVLLPGLPLLEPHDLPSFINHPESYPSVFKMVVGRFSNITDADWIFCNTFDCLEPERRNWKFKTNYMDYNCLLA
ncbi:unnamed protein product [Prunus armeniaca]